MTTLKQGSRGSEVTKLQNTLKGLGYDIGKVDGIFGPKTLAAVQSYQKAQGLGVDGIVGAKTWGALTGGQTNTKPTAGSSTNTNVPQIPKVEAFKPDTSNQPKPPVIKDFVPDESNKPTLPEIAPPPKVDPFNPTIDKAQLQQEALDLLLPQYQRGQEQLSDLYTQNLQRISDDSLKRGLARGSYVGNRQDTEGTEHGKRLGDLDRSYNEQANLMAAQNYETEWGKQYQLHRDNVADTWRGYEADVGNAWRQFDAGMDMYRTDLDNQRFTYSTNTDNAWKNYGALMDLYKIDLDNQRFTYQTGIDNAWQTYQAQYGQHRDSITDTQWQQQFGLSKDQFDWQKKMDQEQLKLAQSRGSGGGGKSSGGSSGSKDNPYAIAYSDIMGSSNPTGRFATLKPQLIAAGIPQWQIQELEAEAKAKAAANRKAQQANLRANTSRQTSAGGSLSLAGRKVSMLT